MPRASQVQWDHKIKLLATILSGGAALASIVSFVAGRRSAHERTEAEGLAAVEVTRIALAPMVDTAWSLGDTLQFTTIAADAHGQALHAVAVHWTVDDPTIAGVDSAGQVVARAPGVTGVTVAIGGRAGRALVVVRPRLTQLAIVSDTLLPIAEGTTLELRVMGSDARGNWQRPDGVTWSGGDAEVAVVDSVGTLRAVAPGQTTVSAAAAGLVAERKVLVTPVPTSMTLTAGAAQRAPAGQRLSNAIGVQVVSRSGRPVAGVEVRFDPFAAMGVSEPTFGTTDSLGVATSRWTLGPVPGRQRLAVEVRGIDSALTVTAEADPTPKNTRIVLQGDSLTAEAGTTITDPVTIQVTDTTGVVLADVPVSWTALDGGSFSQASARTDSMGVAQAHWQVGPKAGRQRAKIQVGNPRSMPPFGVTAHVTAGPADAIHLVSGDAQTGTAGSTLPKAIVLRVTDSLGNGVGAVPIFLSSHSGAVDSTLTTDESGRASTRWTLGKMAGEVRLVARIEDGDESAIAVAVVKPGAPKLIEFASVPSSGTAGRALSSTVRVVVRDQFGNPVPKTTVWFGVTSGKTSLRSGVSDASGAVWTKWTLGPKAGNQVLTASIKSPAVKASHTVKVAAPPAPKSSVSTRKRATKK